MKSLSQLVLGIIVVLMFSSLVFVGNISTAAQSITPNNFSVKNNKVYKNTEQINLYGVNWFGFEDKDLRIHGTWLRPVSDLIQDIKNLGFNSVRVPVCSQTLKNNQVGFINPELNPEYTGLKSLEFLDKFLSELEKNELYFVLTHHSIDCEEISPLWYNKDFSEQDWIDDLTLMANRYRNNKYFLGLDLKNENHSVDGKNHPQWGSGDLLFDWRIAAQKAGKAVNDTNPNILVFVGGIENGQADCSKDDQFLWGENFMPVSCYPIDNESIPENKLVYSPHVYGPDVYKDITYFQDPDFPENMPSLWDDHFGFLLEDNYTLIPGEFGGKYGLETETGFGVESDVLFQNKLIDYYIDKDICNFFYWSFNPNSDDTGGLLNQDWLTPVQSKIDNIARLINHCQAIEKDTLVIDSETLATDTDQGGWSINQFKKQIQNNLKSSNFFTINEQTKKDPLQK